MAYHDDKIGHTQIVVGREYFQFRFYRHPLYKLIRYNDTLGICVLRSESGATRYVSATVLSNWYLAPTGKQ
jgi:hypothetical protein